MKILMMMTMNLTKVMITGCCPHQKENLRKKQQRELLNFQSDPLGEKQNHRLLKSNLNKIVTSSNF